MAAYTLYPSLATLSFALLLAGFFLRAQRGLHASLMSAGIGLDITLVLVLELTKDAVGTVMHEPLTHWQQAHVASSALAVVLYLPVFALGCIRYFRPNAASFPLRKWHARLGLLALTARAFGFAFMFSMLSRSAS